jgi:hypothetical protein
MLSDGMRAQLSENLLQNEALFESSINGRETLYEEVKTQEIPEESEWTGIMRNYRRDPPLELSEEQDLEQYQSMRPFDLTMLSWQH